MWGCLIEGDARKAVRLVRIGTGATLTKTCENHAGWIAQRALLRHGAQQAQTMRGTAMGGSGTTWVSVHYVPAAVTWRGIAVGCGAHHVWIDPSLGNMSNPHSTHRTYSPIPEFPDRTSGFQDISPSEVLLRDTWFLSSLVCCEAMVLGRSICEVIYMYLLIRKDLELKCAYLEGQLGKKL